MLLCGFEVIKQRIFKLAVYNHDNIFLNETKHCLQNLLILHSDIRIITKFDGVVIHSDGGHFADVGSYRQR